MMVPGSAEEYIERNNEESGGIWEDLMRRTMCIQQGVKPIG